MAWTTIEEKYSEGNSREVELRKQKSERNIQKVTCGGGMGGKRGLVFGR